MVLGIFGCRRAGRPSGSRRPPDELAQSPWPNPSNLTWDRDRWTTELAEVYTSVCTWADRWIAWYIQRGDRDKRSTRRLRLASAVFLTLAAIASAVQTALHETLAAPLAQIPWAAVFGIIGGAIVGWQRYWGYSSGWIRFRMTELRLKRTFFRFQGEWIRLHPPIRDPWVRPRPPDGGAPREPRPAADGDGVGVGTVPTLEDVRNMLRRAQTFVDDFLGHVEAEYQAWANEFRQRVRQEMDPQLPPPTSPRR